ncbi:hypothetical protein QW131_12920 [Roseibium salinum]|nr:hypothetical protein [Roseibium salinum]
MKNLQDLEAVAVEGCKRPFGIVFNSGLDAVGGETGQGGFDRLGSVRGLAGDAADMVLGDLHERQIGRPGQTARRLEIGGRGAGSPRKSGKTGEDDGIHTHKKMSRVEPCGARLHS